MPSGPQGQVGANPAPHPGSSASILIVNPPSFNPSRFHATGAPGLVARRNMWVLWGRKKKWELGSRQMYVDVGGAD